MNGESRTKSSLLSRSSGQGLWARGNFKKTKTFPAWSSRGDFLDRQKEITPRRGSDLRGYRFYKMRLPFGIRQGPSRKQVGPSNRGI